MDPEDVSAFVQGDEIRYLGGRQSIVRSYAQRLVEEAFPGQAGQNPFPELPESVHLPEQGPVLFHRLGKTEAGIEDPVLDSVPVRCLGYGVEESDDFEGDIIIFSELLHGLRGASGVHGDIFKAELADC